MDWARAVVHGFLEDGREDIRVFNRSLERSELFGKTLRRPRSAWPWAERQEHAPEAAVIVNKTTSETKRSVVPKLISPVLAKRAVAADLVYVPLATEFLKSAEGPPPPACFCIRLCPAV